MSIDNGWNEYSKLVLGQLENLANNIQVLNSQIQELKQEITRMREREDRVDELRNWKDKIDDINSIRKLIDEVALTNFSDSLNKYVIIDDVNSLNLNSKNALLKIIEEPPEKTIIILIVKVLATIVTIFVIQLKRIQTFLYFHF